MNLSMSNSAPDQKAVQWDDYREEPTINVFDIRLGFDGFAMGNIAHIFPIISLNVS